MKILKRVFGIVNAIVSVFIVACSPQNKDASPSPEAPDMPKSDEEMTTIYGPPEMFENTPEEDREAKPEEKKETDVNEGQPKEDPTVKPSQEPIVFPESSDSFNEIYGPPEMIEEYNKRN